MDEPIIRLRLVSDFNTGNLAGYLANDAGRPAVEPFETAFSELASGLVSGNPPNPGGPPTSALVWTQPERVIHSFRRLLDFQPVSPEDLAAEVDQFAEALLRAAAHLRCLLVPTWVLDPLHRGLGMADLRPGGVGHALLHMNARLVHRMASGTNAFVLDSQRWISRAGAEAWNPRLWYKGKIPFGNRVFQEAVNDIKAALRGIAGQARKLVLIDLDDTIWGGIVGDVGWEKLVLGGHDAAGEAYVDFQGALKALTARGIVLGIISKNEESVALQAIERHPEMRLRLDDFAGWRINWRDKAENVIDLLQELNLGPEAAVFIDDSPVERARVGDELPDVLVPEWPENPLFFKTALSSLACFDTPTLSREDTQRTSAYAAERKRTAARPQLGSLEEWLKSLQILVTVEDLSPQNQSRVVQLLNKTNQMNLTTRRVTEPQLEEWRQQNGRRLWAFRVADKFGDAGLTGVASLEIDGPVGRIADFVLSCRVMGRKIEESMLYWLILRAREMGLATVRAEYRPTPKNKPCLGFWEGSGFHRDDAHTFAWGTDREYPLPGCLQLSPLGR